MKNTEIIYSALQNAGINTELELEEVKTDCMLCGKEIEKGAKLKKVVSSKFTDYDLFININGTHICKECATCIKTRKLRTNNIIADKCNLYLLNKNDLEEYLFNIDKYVKGEFIVGITQSFKKHNSYRCKVNEDTDIFYIREEDKEYEFNRIKLRELYRKLNEAYLYFQKDEILTGQYSITRIQEFGIKKFQAYEQKFKKFRNTHQFNLLVYILNSARRNEIVKERVKKQKEEQKHKKMAEKEKKKEMKGQLSLF